MNAFQKALSKRPWQFCGGALMLLWALGQLEVVAFEAASRDSQASPPTGVFAAAGAEFPMEIDLSDDGDDSARADWPVPLALPEEQTLPLKTTAAAHAPSAAAQGEPSVHQANREAEMQVSDLLAGEHGHRGESNATPPKSAGDKHEAASVNLRLGGDGNKSDARSNYDAGDAPDSGKFETPSTGLAGDSRTQHGAHDVVRRDTHSAGQNAQSKSPVESAHGAARKPAAQESPETEEGNAVLKEAPDLPASPHLTDASQVAAREAKLHQWQFTLEMARRMRKENDFEQANRCLESILDSAAPDEMRRTAFLELAFVAQQSKKYTQAQKIFSKYIQKYPDDPSVPELMLRQGLLYQEMGAFDLALAKFFSVMSAALKIKNDRLDYYKELVLYAQIQIAETYYSQANYHEAAKKLESLLALDAPNLRRDQIQAKLILCLSASGRSAEAAAQAEDFLKRYENSEEVPEMRFHLASAYKKMGREHAALEQVLALLKSQAPTAIKNPENWRTWQQRTGNQIADQLCKDGNYMDALQVYQTLAQIDAAPRWQFPVLYQVGLVYERLQMPEKAAEVYASMMAREKELSGENTSPSIRATLEMAKWRRNFLDWEGKTEKTNQKIRTASATALSTTSNP